MNLQLFTKAGINDNRLKQAIDLKHKLEIAMEKNKEINIDIEERKKKVVSFTHYSWQMLMGECLTCLYRSVIIFCFHILVLIFCSLVIQKAIESPRCCACFELSWPCKFSQIFHNCIWIVFNLHFTNDVDFPFSFIICYVFIQPCFLHFVWN